MIFEVAGHGPATGQHPLDRLTILGMKNSIDILHLQIWSTPMYIFTDVFTCSHLYIFKNRIFMCACVLRCRMIEVLLPQNIIDQKSLKQNNVFLLYIGNVML